MNKLYIIFIVILFIGCNEDEKNTTYITKGYFITQKIYEVIAYGAAPKDIKREIHRRNMAREAALLAAQIYIKDKFNNSRPGIVVKTEYRNNRFCKLIYRVEINTNNYH